MNLNPYTIPIYKCSDCGYKSLTGKGEKKVCYGCYAEELFIFDSYINEEEAERFKRAEKKEEEKYLKYLSNPPENPFDKLEKEAHEDKIREQEDEIERLEQKNKELEWEKRSVEWDRKEVWEGVFAIVAFILAIWFIKWIIG